MQTGPEQGMLFDYGRLDAAVKPIIDALDHKHLNDLETVFGEPLYPTAENIAEYLAVRICRVLWPMLKERRLFLWIDVSETPKSSATFEMDMTKAQAFCGPIE
jgi:6-pyruvoyl-tetrahydropterin synthase